MDGVVQRAICYVCLSVEWRSPSTIQYLRMQLNFADNVKLGVVHDAALPKLFQENGRESRFIPLCRASTYCIFNFDLPGQILIWVISHFSLLLIVHTIS